MAKVFSVLLAALTLMLPGRPRAQTITNIFNSDALRSGQTNVYGAQIIGGLILSSNTLYGATTTGGTNGLGAIFSITTNGAVAFLRPFSGIPPGQGTNSDGFSSYASLLVSGTTLYGTARDGGTYAYGTLFSLSTGGTNYAVLHMFNSSITNGEEPMGGVILSGSTLYGTTSLGGTNGGGVVYSVNTNGAGFVILRAFTSPTDGGSISSSLILSGGTLYGAAELGGPFSAGTLFSLNTNGTYPNSLILSGGTLYGTTQLDKTNSSGVIFSISTNGTGFTVLHYFNGSSNDGSSPQAGLVLSGNMLVGTTDGGGSPQGYGSIFAINTNGTGYTILHAFQGPLVYPPDGEGSQSAPVASGNNIYGAAGGGLNGSGVIFSLAVPTPQLNLAANNKTNVILTWTTNASAFLLQSSTNLLPPAVWNTVSPAPAIVNGKNTVTNSISGKQVFYRLAL